MPAESSVFPSPSRWYLPSLKNSVAPGLIAGRGNALHDEIERRRRVLQIGREAALIADIGAVAGLLQFGLQGLEHLGAHAQAFGECGRAQRRDHEFLEVDGIVGMRAAVDDVHQRHRQRARLRAADIFVERQPARQRRRLGASEAHAQDRVGAEAALVGRAVEGHELFVDRHLVFGVEAGKEVEDLAVHRIERLAYALAEIALLVAVALLHRFVRAGGGARRHRGAAAHAILERDIDLDGRVAARIEDLAADDIDDGGHGQV
jgi:hypothetical protein